MLVGQYDSPFVRRAAVALHHHGIAFERQVLSVFQDFERMLEINPLGKVPTLILPDGRSIFDSRAIIEYLDARAEEEETRLTPADPADRVAMLQVEAVGIGLAEKTYERGIEFSRRAPGKHDPDWIARLERQIGSALAWLDARMTDEFYVAGRLTRADLAAVAGATYLAKKQPQLYVPERIPALDAYRCRLESMPAFRAAAYSEADARATGWQPERT